MLARWGGDEFVLLMPYEEDFLHAVLNELQSTELESAVSVGMSVGYSVYPDDGNTLETLIQKADQAMYKDKHAEMNN